MSMVELLRSSFSYFKWSNIKLFYRQGLPGATYGGYEGGRLARRRALARKKKRAHRRFLKASEKLDLFDRQEEVRRREAHARANLEHPPRVENDNAREKA